MRSIAAIALLFTVGFAVAEDPAPAPKADLMAQFKAADADKDGTVSAEELAAVADEAAKAALTAADADADGAVTKDEIKAAKGAGKEHGEKKEKKAE